MFMHLLLLLVLTNGIPAQESPGTPRYDPSRFYEIDAAAKFDFSAIEKRVTPAFKRNEFRKVLNGVKEYIEANRGPGPLPDSVTGSMHFLDLNRDGRDDLVIQMTESGWPVTYVCLNRRGSYFTAIRATGPIVELRPASRSIMLCDIKTGGYSMEDYILHYVLDAKKAVLTKKIQFSQGTIFPKQRPMDRPVTVLHEGAPLTTEPCDDESAPRYPKGATGRVLAMHKDASGAEWCFLVMNNDRKPWIITGGEGRTGKAELPGLAAGGDDVPVLRCGWMRAEQCGKK